MSIRGSVHELNKEIERLTGIRDSLLHIETDRATRGFEGVPSKVPGKTAADVRKSETVPGRSGTVKSASKQKSGAKRVVSDATRRKMSEAARARSAAKKSASVK